jgi:hypothetical protein
MNFRTALIGGLLFSTCALAQEVAPSCKTSPNIVGACFTVEGRLFTTSARPRIRIQPKVSAQLLGVYDRQFRLESAEVVPKAVDELLSRDPAATAVEGEFFVCPFEKDASAAIRMVCIESADHLAARPRDVNETRTHP